MSKKHHTRKSTQLADIQLGQWACQNGRVPHLRLWYFLRHHARQSAGYFTSGRNEIRACAAHLNLPVGRIKNILLELEDLGWIIRVGRKLRLKSIRSIKSSLDLRIQLRVVLDLSVLQSHSRFKAFLAAAYVSMRISYIQTRAKKTAINYRDKAPEVRRRTRKEHSHSKGANKQRISGTFALSLVAEDMGFSIATASALRKIGRMAGFLAVERRFDRSTVTPAESRKSFLTGFPDLRRGFQGMPAKSGGQPLFYAVRLCDVLSSKLILVKPYKKRKRG